MKNKSVIVIMLLAVVAIAGYFIWKNNSKPAEIKTTKVGAVLPLTGNVAVFGKWIQNGLELGLSNFKTENPESKDKVKLVIEDSKNEAKDGVNALNKLITTDKIDIVISAMSKVVVPLISVTEEKKLPLFMQDVTYPNITSKGNLLFRHFVQSDREATLLSNYALNTLKVNNVAIIYVNDEAGIGAKDAFSKIFSALGSILTEQSFEAKETDFKTLADKVIGMKPECIFLFGNGPSWSNCLKSLHQQNYQGTILTNTAMYIPSFRKIAGEESLNNVVFTFPVIDSTSASGKKFISQYQGKFNEYPSIESAYAYDIITLICQASKSEGDQSLFDKLNSVKTFDGAFGTTQITNRDCITKVGVAKWIGNSYSILSIN
jgi:branched-chain amino acid transport system substrate-binding protein